MSIRFYQNDNHILIYCVLILGNHLPFLEFFPALKWITCDKAYCLKNGEPTGTVSILAVREVVLLHILNINSS